MAAATTTKYKEYKQVLFVEKLGTGCILLGLFV